ncbi:hypothetical protein A2567_02710 [Candidatus Azambacteria bacterium RIFOXYD1_FULL_42_11]|uniref:Galactose-1-phosphate uridylyltransferase n=4 Tax=Candidatus Azamiibacteriota TaxID=1752741 RepID=A0A0G1C8B8_9BACT|nr:MAG: Galactose-1-phosphate uridylyltransferase [Candidatus Azambacteria bacterium GW2011_GWB1_42_17]KKS45878.1 MAG: Galactose-1-phosphate uridylyltransferase [Candidatus Azambacteria bacterium GW2011_GWA1_42_19]KKS75245.1 MAG: Galactose-1-phosphate uridylyltransferase [Candidatus Azambacteria bacterium GW2011_GWA2_42_9]KKS88346.1 MAG: Galactose-1-phosphate uridylyltransferase [Parcubacteria group bacterium GW2011_GWC1_43_11]OGD41944.1 MAG: hypothetical protein A2567_02710 [Candidatus Azambac
MKKLKTKPTSELRRDPVSGDWILLAPLRSRRHKFEGREKVKLAKSRCPFENPAKFGNFPPVLVYQKEDGKDWFLQVIPNKYPAVGPDGHGSIYKDGLYQTKAGTGFHEIVIFRDHDRCLAEYNAKEMERVVSAYRERYLSLANNKFVEYISIFHNHGKEAGSTVSHPHSQILALPIIPPDVSHSISGSRRYFHERKKCIHCEMLRQEIKENKRIIYENKDIVVVSPFTSRVNFEVRIFPKKHSAYFEKISNQALASFADASQVILSRIFKKLKDPAFNFFIHTAPTIKNQDYNHYHWHMEILPKFEITGSIELGTGLNIISVAPEMAAKILK